MVTCLELQFSKLPSHISHPHQTKMNQVESTLVREEIQEMLRKGEIHCPSPKREEFISNLFVVSKKHRGQKPAKNLKIVSAIPSFQDGESTLSKGLGVIE